MPIQRHRSIVPCALMFLLLAPLAVGCGGGGPGGPGRSAAYAGAAGDAGTFSVGGSSHDGSGGSAGSVATPPGCAVEQPGTYVVPMTNTYDDLNYVEADQANVYFMDRYDLYAQPLNGDAPLLL